jgi:anti-anti-sigma regulatory factor
MVAKKNTPKAEASEVVIVAGQLDRGLDQAERIMAADKVNIVLDFKNCTFVTVEGLEWLEELLLRSESKKHNVTFTNIPPVIYKVFKVCHTDSILKACGAPATTSGSEC